MEEETKEAKPNRHIFLWVLGIISAIANALIIVINVLLLFGTPAINFVLKIPVLDTLTEEELHGNAFYFLIRIIIHGFVIYTLNIILRLKRRGFFYYLGAQIALLILPFIFLTSLGIPYLLISFGVSSIFSFFFIMLFSLYIPKMTNSKE